MIRPPHWISAALAALRFQCRDLAPLRLLSNAEWRRLIGVCDRSQLTLPLASVLTIEESEPGVPAWVVERMRASLEKTRLRSKVVVASYQAILNKLHQHNVDFVVLKGFASAPEFIADPARRVQYDLDLFLPSDRAGDAYERIRELGYTPVGALESFPTDHLPVLVKQTGWAWRGDYFDPEIPVSVDLHFRLWDRETEQFDAPGWEDFWRRRTVKHWDGLQVPAFAPIDSLAYHCLHLLRHLLRGDLRLSHIHELGYFLHNSAGDGPFWTLWRDTHSPQLRELQAICFALAHAWFDCALPDLAADQIARLSAPSREWLDRYCYAPVTGLVKPNKHELWLHMGLVEGWEHRRRVLVRRLFPGIRSGPSGAVFVRPKDRTWSLRLHHERKLLAHRIRRGWHHLRVIPSAIVHGIAWWWRFRRARKSPESAGNSGPP